MAERAASLGPAAHYWLEVEWPELYRRAEALRAAGTDAADPQVRKLVRRLDELADLFSGGDPAVSEGVRAAWHDDPAAMADAVSAPADQWRDLAAYLDHARALATEQP